MLISPSDLQHGQPLFMQIGEIICGAIRDGRLGAGDRLPTENSVARELQVSRLTVSRAYDQLREQGLIDQRRGSGSFVTDQAPAILKVPKRRSLQNVGFVFDACSFDAIPSVNQFILLDLLDGISEVCEPVHINICYQPIRGETLGGPDALAKRLGGLDGLILAGYFNRAQQAVREALHRIERPAVALWSEQDWPDIPSVQYDGEAAARLAAEHLLAQGYRRLAYIGLLEHARASSKHGSFVAALADRGLALDAADQIHAVSLQQTYQRTHAYLAEVAQPPEAIFVDTDHRAMRVIQAITEAGYRVPRDIAVMGYDDVPEAATFDPPLTTVHTPRRAGGRRAAELLREVPPASAETRHEVLSPRLVVRGSAEPVGVRARPTA